jgi:hypothetical protein
VDTIFKILRVKATTVSVRLQIFSMCVNKYQQAFWRRCQGNGYWISYEPSLALYYTFHFLLDIPFCFYPYGYRQHTYHLTIFSTHECKLEATTIFKVYPNTWLWATVVFYKHDFGTILLERRRCKPILSPTVVWADLCIIAYFWHVWRDLKMEALSVLFDEKS